jgi:hypothetical protein
VPNFAEICEKSRGTNQEKGLAVPNAPLPALPQMKPCTRGGLINGGAGNTSKVVGTKAFFIDIFIGILLLNILI